MHEFDAELLQDFITESSELLDQFDGDLVLLESTPTDPDLLNRVFRALHTIKGSASFLSLGELVRVAHAAEEALNNARRGGLLVTREVMDLLLEAADVIKGHLAQLQSGDSALAPARAALVDELTKMGQATDGAPGAPGAPGPAIEEDMESQPAGTLPGRFGERATLDLPVHKADLLEFMASDFEESVARMDAAVEALGSAETREDGCADLRACCEPMTSAVAFFELPALAHLVQAIDLAAERVMGLDDSHAGQLLARLGAMVAILRENAEALKSGVWVDVEADALIERVTDLALGNPIAEDAWLGDGSSAADALRVDCGIETAAAAAPALTLVGTEAAAPAPGVGVEPQEPQEPQESGGDRPAAGPGAGGATIRVDIVRLEALLDLVGELVLQKNRVTALTRKVGILDEVDRDTRDALAQGASDLDRVCGDLQLAVMRTRMQPLDKLFGRYPRLIRDLARSTNKKLRLVIEGGDTEVDKSVIEQLGDPLVHILRNSSDHGVETPEARKAAGKSETGTITLRARHEGEHVLVEICDDGRGLDREKILARAVERGLCTADEGAAMSESQVFQFIFAPGFSTAEQVTDLSGRGVGMDVVRTNIEKVKGEISLRSALGEGTTVSIAIPLTVAILDAMVIGVGDEEYAIPLGNIVEIVKPAEKDISTIHGRRVMRLREDVLPLIDGCEIFGVPEAHKREAPFAVVLSMNGRSAGLMVSRLIGQREIVVKSLESQIASNAPVSGATVGDEGEASLIIDVARLLEMASAKGRAGRAGGAAAEGKAPARLRAAA